jgi:DNA polymerase-3 subunit epsilon
MKKVFYDIETTGFSFKDVDRILEIAAVEYHDDGTPTGEEFYALIDPGRSIPAEVTAIHGITDERVRGMPKFKDIAPEFMAFIEGKEVIAHNGNNFDEPFINAEMVRAGMPYTFWEKPAKTTDSLKVARQVWPKQLAKLDIILDRLGIDRSERERVGHNARLDCQLLAQAFFAMTKDFDMGQFAAANHEIDVPRAPILRLAPSNLPLAHASPSEMSAHELSLDTLDKKSGGPCVARAFATSRSGPRP